MDRVFWIDIEMPLIKDGVHVIFVRVIMIFNFLKNSGRT